MYDRLVRYKMMVWGLLILLPALYFGFNILEKKQTTQLNAALHQHVTEKTQLEIHQQLQQQHNVALVLACLLYTSDAADE